MRFPQEVLVAMMTEKGETIMAEMYARGRFGEVYLLDDNKVLKLFFPEVPKEDAEQEYKNCKLAYENGCTPIKVYDLVEQDGRYGFTMDFCPGMSQNDYSGKHPGYILKGGIDLAKQHYIVHSKKCHELRDIRTYTCDLLDNCEHFGALTKDEKERAKKYIMSLPEEDTIIHLDFHTGNVMIDDTGKCRTVDWTTAFRGNRAIEVAMMEHFFSEAELFAEASDMQNWFYDKVRRIVGHYYFKEYKTLMPISSRDIDRYRLPALVFRRSWDLVTEREILDKHIKDLIAKYGID